MRPGYAASGAPPSATATAATAAEIQWISAVARHYGAAEPSRRGKDVPLYTV